MTPGERWDSDDFSRLEEQLELGLAGTFVCLWFGFLVSLWRDGSRGWFIALVVMHLLPAPVVLVGSETESKQFLGWAAFGGLALILGLPHHGWPKGRRGWPRVVTTVAVLVGLGLLYVGRRSLA